MIRFSPYLPRPVIIGKNETVQQPTMISASVLLRYNSKNVSDEKTLHKDVYVALKQGALPIDAHSIEISHFVPGMAVRGCLNIDRVCWRVTAFFFLIARSNNTEAFQKQPADSFGLKNS